MTESVEQQSGFSSLICLGKATEICNCCGAKLLFCCGRETVAVYYSEFILMNLLFNSNCNMCFITNFSNKLLCFYIVINYINIVIRHFCAFCI